MQVSVAFVPPPEVVDLVAEAVARVAGVRDELDVVDRRSLRLPVIGLGNLTKPDATALCTHLEDAVAELETTAEIGLRGVWALEDEADPGIALNLTGDVDEATRIAKSLPGIVKDHGYFVDRRRFVPRMTVARVTDRTTVPVLERLVAALGEVRTRTWEVSAAQVLLRVHHDDGVGFDVFRSLPTTRAGLEAVRDG